MYVDASTFVCVCLPLKSGFGYVGTSLGKLTNDDDIHIVDQHLHACSLRFPRRHEDGKRGREGDMKGRGEKGSVEAFTGDA